ncbi:hypothetical protein QJS10_CPA01g01734 [Acorus calamus]|uniref:Uncharacterized protein n=1 Tax=Acorus calamus TaxID=4465 RepID=A0AAV9FJH2_ACOCL|nr:hypothetical protein QJS10_CPA01g01734 [Acorus calamus]
MGGVAGTWELLDRAFANNSWSALFPSALVTVLPRHISDHAPLLLDSEISPPTGWKPFRFERFWFEPPDLIPLVTQTWRSIQDASPMGQVHQNLRSLQQKLRLWNRSRIDNLPKVVDQAQKSLDELLKQEQLSSQKMDMTLTIRSASN